MGELLNTQQAADALGVKDTSTVRQAILRGSLTAEKIGRDWFVTPKEIERYRKNKEENWRKTAKEDMEYFGLKIGAVAEARAAGILLNVRDEVKRRALAGFMDVSEIREVCQTFLDETETLLDTPFATNDQFLENAANLWSKLYVFASCRDIRKFEELILRYSKK